MMLTIAQIEAAAPWTHPQEIPTKLGPRVKREIRGQIPETFWQLWNRHRPEMAALGVSPRLREQVWSVTWWQEVAPAVLAQRQDTLALSRAAEPDPSIGLDLPIPDGLAYLGYQRVGIAYALGKEGTLIADEMGLGKTIQAIGLMNAIGKARDVLIVCPAKLKINWRRELHKWLVPEMTCAIADGKCWPTTQIVIVNYELATRYQKRMEARLWDLIILDEGHRCKNPEAAVTKAIVGFKPNKKEREAGILPSSGLPARRKLVLTGTPILNKPIELWPLLQWLDRKTWHDWWQFVSRYCGAKRTSFGLMTKGATHLDELQEKLRTSCMVRRLKKDVLKDLPAKRRQVIVLPAEGLGKGIKAAEDAALVDYEEKLCKLKARCELAKADDNDREYLAALSELKSGGSVSFDQIAKVRHQTALAKLPLVKEHIEAALEELDKAIVFAYHRDVVETLFSDFEGVGALKIYGGMSDTATQAAVDAFQNDPYYKLMVISIPVAIGMNLTAASHGFFVEEDWVPAKMSQAEDRMHRIGQRESVNIYHLVLEGSLDCNMAETLVYKQDIIDRALDRLAAEAEAQEPIIPTRKGHVTVSRTELADLAQRIKPHQVQAVHACLRAAANGKAWAGQSMATVDGIIGRTLAGQLFLSAKQAVIGRRLIKRHRNALPADLVAQAVG